MVKSARNIQLAVLVLALCVGCGDTPPTAPDSEQPEVSRHFQFSKNPGVTIPVLRRDLFLQRFVHNVQLPRTDAAVVDLAHKVFVAPELLNLPPEETCLEYWEGTVLGALSSPDISDAARRRVDMLMAAPLPAFNKTFISGHFKFYFTDNDPDPKQNVTLADVMATAKVFNDAWDDYAKNFTTPKHKLISGKPIVQVRIYYLGSSLYGSTSSSSNYVRISSTRVARARCKRESTPVHELFHRVQYAYGYKSGASEKYWAVEGTAAWSQKYRAGHIGDYLSRVSSGLASPDKELFARKYDAINLWLHLGRWTGDEQAGVKLVWQNFAAMRSRYRYPLMPALDATLQTLVGRDRDHEWLVEQWSLANLLKDTANPAHTQTYHEQGQLRRCDGKIYGPVPKVKLAKNQKVKPGPALKFSGQVTPYGSDYWVFELDPTAKSVKLQAQGQAAVYAFNVAQLDASNKLLQLTGSGRRVKQLKLSRTISPKGIRSLKLVVTAMGQGGKYSVEVEAK